jgi:hypothetical protein
MRAPFADVAVAVNRRRLDVSAKPLEISGEPGGGGHELRVSEREWMYSGTKASTDWMAAEFVRSPSPPRSCADLIIPLFSHRNLLFHTHIHTTSPHLLPLLLISYTQPTKAHYNLSHPH